MYLRTFVRVHFYLMSAYLFFSLRFVPERSEKNGPHFSCQGFARASFYYPLPFYVFKDGAIYSRMNIY